MDGQWAVDVRARNVVPIDIDDAFALRGEMREGGREEIKMVGSTAGALIDDHCGDVFAAMVDGDAAAAW